MYDQQQTSVGTKPDGNGFAITSLVLGIIGVVFNIIPFLPYFLGILAIIFGILGTQKFVSTGLAKAGIVLGGITIGMKVLFWMFIIGLGSLG